MPRPGHVCLPKHPRVFCRSVHFPHVWQKNTTHFPQGVTKMGSGKPVIMQTAMFMNLNLIGTSGTTFLPGVLGGDPKPAGTCLLADKSFS